MKNLILICIFYSFLFETQGAGEKIHIEALDSRLDLGILSDKVYSKNTLEDNVGSTLTLPSPYQLELLLHQVGLEQEFKNLDQMDRDIFALKCKDNEIDQLVKYYPNIPKLKLIKFKSKLLELR